jgi:hypothetical protein
VSILPFDSAEIDAESRSDLPGNRTVGSLLLTALALSNDHLLVYLREPQVLQRVELSRHSCLGLAVQDDTWLSAWQAIHDLQQVLVSPIPSNCSVIQPYTNALVLETWREIDVRMSMLRGLLR